MEVKKKTRGEWSLEHSRYIDFLGFERDSLKLTHVDTKSGKTIHYPFMPLIKVSDYDRNAPITTTTDYSEEEYDTMFSEELNKHVMLTS